MGKGGLIALTALAACAAPVSGTPASETPVWRTVGETPTPPSTGQNPAASAADLCRAGEMQWLVGKPKTEIPVPVEMDNRRVTCTTCAVTEDYSPRRLNIFFNEQTGIVEQVRCG